MANTYKNAFDLQVNLRVSGDETKNLERFWNEKHIVDVELGREWRDFVRRVDSNDFHATVTLDVDDKALAEKLNGLSLSSLGGGKSGFKKVLESDDAYIQRLKSQATDLAKIINDSKNKVNNSITMWVADQYALKPEDRSATPKDTSNYFEKYRKSVDKYVQSLISLEAIEREIMKYEPAYSEEATALTFGPDLMSAMKMFYKLEDTKLTMTPFVPSRAEVEEEVKEVQEAVSQSFSPSISEFVVTDEAIASIKSQIESKLSIDISNIGGEIADSATSIGDAVVAALRTALENADFNLNLNGNNNGAGDNGGGTGGGAGRTGGGNAGGNNNGGGNNAPSNNPPNGGGQNNIVNDGELRDFVAVANNLLTRIRTTRVNLEKINTDETLDLADEVRLFEDNLQASINDANDALESGIATAEQLQQEMGNLARDYVTSNRGFAGVRPDIPTAQYNNYTDKQNERILSTAEKLATSAQNYINQITSRANTLKRRSPGNDVSAAYLTAIGGLPQAIENVLADPNAANVEVLSAALKEAQFDVANLGAAFNNLDNQLKSDAAMRREAQATQNLSIQIDNLRKKIEKYGQTNSAMMKDSSLRAQYEAILNRAANLNTEDPDAVKVVNRDFINLQRRVSELGKTGMSTGNRIKAMFEKFGGWSLVTRSLARVYSLIRKIGSAVKELDTAMVNLKKVSDASAEEYDQFLTRAANSAQKLGTSITDLVDATAEFSRLGYNLEDSATLGEYATLYSRVAEDLTASDAAQSIVSTMKAFKMAAEDAISIVDLFNYVGRIIAQVCRNVYKQIAISVKSQRWSRPRKDLFIGIRNDCNTLRGNTSGFAILEDTV